MRVPHPLRVLLCPALLCPTLPFLAPPRPAFPFRQEVCRWQWQPVGERVLLRLGQQLVGEQGRQEEAQLVGDLRGVAPQQRAARHHLHRPHLPHLLRAHPLGGRQWGGGQGGGGGGKPRGLQHRQVWGAAASAGPVVRVDLWSCVVAVRREPSVPG